jgi:hypothetical protein
MIYNNSDIDIDISYYNDDDDDDDDDDELLQSYKATKLQSSRLEIHGQSIDQDCHQCRCCITSRS